MRKGKALQVLRILIWLIAPISFFSCKTPGSVSVDAALAALTPPMPLSPVMEPVRFEGRDGGLWLSYSDYRSLERNVIAMREYIEKLEIIIRFYRDE